MPTTPLVSTDRAYLIDTNGEYVVAETTTPNQPLVTPNASLTSNARHVVTRSGNTVVATSSGRDIYTRGGIGPLVTPRSSLIVQPVTGAIATTADTYDFALYDTALYAAIPYDANIYDAAQYDTASYA